MYVNAKNVIYFDSFAVEHIPKEIRKVLRNKNIEIINSMFQRKRLLEYANLFSPNEYEKNDEIILRYFQ